MGRPAVKDILNIIDGIARFSLAEPWDNSGLQAGNPLWPADRILVALDVSDDVMAAAAEQGCGMVVCHHPLMISPEKSIDFSQYPGSVIFSSAKHNIAVVSAHTNLDRAYGGLNDYFAEKIGMTCQAPCKDCGGGPAPDDPGFGRTGSISPAVSLRTLADHLKQTLDIPWVRVIGNPETQVSNVAVCTGSGGSLIDWFLGTPADVYITGDVKYHEARTIELAGRTCIDVGHFASEHIVVDLLTRRLEQECASRGCETQILGYHREKDPFRII